MYPRLLPCLLMLLAGWTPGCVLDSPPNSTYRCKTDKDCLEGEHCLERLCRSTASLQDGSPSQLTCSPTCSGDRQLCCESGCVDPSSDTSNCGKCGFKCDPGEVCLGGHCTPEVCDNGLDDNKDGKIDCQDDVTCADATPCRGGLCCHGQCASESSGSLCSNGLDDDCDGKKDCEDSKCVGQTCGMGKVCDAAKTCADGCFIDGAFFANGAPNPQSPCFACNASKATHEWSPVDKQAPSGTCLNGLACDGAGRCRRVNGQACATSNDCVSGKCSLTGVCAP